MEAKGCVSVIVVSYNHSKYVKECLDSLLSQEYENWELIVADDASKDDSVAEINKWLEANNIDAKKNFHSINTGMCTVLNECIHLCNGEYIKIISADDFMHPALLKNAIRHFELLDDDFGIVYSNAGIVDQSSNNNGKSFHNESSNHPSGWIKEALLNYNFIPAATVVIKRKVFEMVGDYDVSFVAEDYDFWLRASEFFRFQYMPEILAFYRLHRGNISLNYDLNFDIVKTILKHDTKLSQKERINIFFKEKYYKSVFTDSLKTCYYSYNGRNKWMTWCLKNNISYIIFRVVDKFFY